MKTKRLYYTEPYRYEQEASVIRCDAIDAGGYEVVLDATIYFAEGGGQPSDSGRIGGQYVKLAIDRGEEIVYVLDTPFAVGERVKVEIDPRLRLDHARRHTGEHMISGLAKRMYGAANVGFHMGDGYATIDLDRELTESELTELELAANAGVMANEQVASFVVAPSEVANYKLRKDTTRLAAGSEPVRVVEIGGDIDGCACCGTHTMRTGDVGMISIVEAKRYKGGMRLWYECGEAAVQDAIRRRQLLDAAAQGFSVGYDAVPEAIERLRRELSETKSRLREATGLVMKYRAKELIAATEPESTGLRVIVTIEQNCTGKDAKLLADSLLEETQSVVLVLGVDGGTVSYVLASNAVGYDMGEAAQAVNAILGGKGGGRGALAQGRADYRSSSELDQAATQLYTWLHRSGR